MKVFLIASAISLGVAALAGTGIAVDAPRALKEAGEAQLFKSLPSSPFAVAGSKAAENPDFVSVTPGLVVQSVRGEEIGTVERMITNRNGSVVSFLVNMGDRSAMIPYARLRSKDGGLVSAMDEAAIRKIISEPFIIDAKYQTNAIAEEPVAQE